MDAVGELGTPIEHGRLLAHGSARPGFFIEGGFSGAPLLDETTNAVIGMVNAAARDATRSARRSSFPPTSSNWHGRRWPARTRG